MTTAMNKFTKSMPVIAIAFLLGSAVATVPSSFNLNLSAQAQSESNQEKPRNRPPRPDLDAAAKKLGVTKEKLIEALGIPPKPPEDGNGDRP
ncbi:MULTISPECIES: hypothetical protein [Pseudanabaena]|uniref:Uncharacterized protein n=2 Tax=Pseudanabaena TaxID=1152 RepID=L8MU51_9CYAN|nr:MULTISPECIES: hypothetical protein [Pseudanabaena]ELS31497.1 hypothetical protein Pse7429DRAFT_3345 [Pseudanabaena biceps PCC 7429]MDG3496243.1 hypothetical protein [Pseudanabaena catenata USMAC16]